MMIVKTRSFLWVGVLLMVMLSRAKAGNYTNNALDLFTCSDFVKTEGSYWCVNMPLHLIAIILMIMYCHLQKRLSFVICNHFLIKSFTGMRLRNVAAVSMSMAVDSAWIPFSVDQDLIMVPMKDLIAMIGSKSHLLVQVSSKSSFQLNLRDLVFQ